MGKWVWVKFAKHFAEISTLKDQLRADEAAVELQEALQSSDRQQPPFIGAEQLKLLGLKQLKANVATGFDGLDVNYLKHAPNILFEHLAHLMNLCFVSGSTPLNFRTGILIPLVKNPLASRCTVTNYRDITLSTILSKLFEAVVLHFCAEKLDTSELQFAYKACSGPSQAVFALTELVNASLRRDCPTYCAFLDISKAFNSVNHDVLLKKLLQRQVNSEIVRTLQHWLKDVNYAVSWQGETSDSFSPECSPFAKADFFLEFCLPFIWMICFVS